MPDATHLDPEFIRGLRAGIDAACSFCAVGEPFANRHASEHPYLGITVTCTARHIWSRYYLEIPELRGAQGLRPKAGDAPASLSPKAVSKEEDR